MGTVPDPLRSARLSLVAASEEESGLRQRQSPKHQHSQASIETNSNGFPFPAKGQNAGELLFEVNSATEADDPMGEQHCGYDTRQPSMFSPGSSSPSKECCPAALEPLKNSQQEGSNGSRDEGQPTAEGSSLGPVADKVPPTQEASEMVQIGAGEQLCRAVDEASSTSGAGSHARESKTHENSALTTHSNAQQDASVAKETGGEMTGPEKTPAPASVRESEAASDLGGKSHVGSEVELNGTKDASSHLRTVPELVPKSDLESTSRPSCSAEAVEEAAPELSKFRDTGTMTVQADSKPGAGEATSTTHQDAEVQAVASMESKSASTSPSIFAAFLRESMPSEARPKQEQLHVIYTGAGGKEQSEIVDGFVPLVQTAPSTGVMPEVHLPALATGGALGVHTVQLRDSPAGTHDTVRLSLLDTTKSLCPLASGGTQEASVNRVEAQIAGMASNLSDVSQQPLDSSILLKTRPVYQITVNTSNQPGPLPQPVQPVNTETKLPPLAALPEFHSKHQHSGPCAKENSQASPSCRDVSEHAKAAVGAQGSNYEENLQTKTVGDLGTGAASFHVDVKPQREEKLISLDPKGQKISHTGAAAAAAGTPTTCTPVVTKREHGGFPKHKKEMQAAGLESELSRNSAPGLGSQVIKSSETRKGPKLDPPAAPTSSQPVPAIGEKKKEPRPATDAKVQLKQSKRIRDVVWDEQGMTWEVYGASLDPESLGVAIQNHLQRQIREHEKLIKVQSTQNRKSISSDTSSNKKLKGRQHNVFQSVLQNFRRPNCCVRPAASSVLD
ncbi:G protein-regulated inducer of neurite outgrowth 3 [Hemicordylus capensis]|uniref:G protein-regulated inducer of neurite outgrowth 3 n=1 Tax=Hemicordylus capensis TaxID=884348 RepID=UPI00230478AA|nr:G protein-regulated inducer of neurite outgrowth 3 [Hemicordylus capensis]XP_053112662.1 G protein-regulated inducer of neurite outgrowth 3 [Hemicordylus capensis]